MIESIFILAYGAFKGLADWQMKTNGQSWRNKYKQPFEPIPSGLYGKYHKIQGLAYKERFFGSGSFLVVFTDWWHFFQTCQILTIYGLSIYLLGSFPWLLIPAYWVGFGITYKFANWFKK